jgi:formiminotetrahydrofolate cyclodeaminase
VRINLPSVADEALRAEIGTRTEAMLAACEAKARELTARV